MGPPVRTICIDCLQSIEVSSTGEPDHCPHCGVVQDLARIGVGIASRANFPQDGFATLAASDSDDSTGLTDDSTLAGAGPMGAPPRSVGRFQIRQVLGEGGYGQVYRAFDSHLEREVALKVLKPNRFGQKALERFFREARAAARLDHPNIVALHDAGRDEGRCWIAYQLISGRTLSAVRDHQRPGVAESIRIVRDLAHALHHAHGRGIFHRDLKPANVMIDDAGRPRLTDFGLARRGDVDSDLTTEGTVLGTPQYMSPEAAAGRAREADARSDVYSLGVILFELLCGKRPCDLPSGAPLWRATPYSTPPTPRSVDRSIPPALDRICMKALAFDPAERHSDADLLAQALSEQLDKVRPTPPRRARSAASPPGDPSPSAPPRPRLDRRRVGVAALVTLPVLASALVWTRPAAPVAEVAPLGTATVRPAVAVGPAPAAQRRPVGPLAADPTASEAGSPGPAPAAAESGPESATVPAPVTVIGNTEGTHRYHHPTCKFGPRTKKRTKLFGSVAEAVAEGYSPCHYCGSRFDDPPAR